MNISQKSVKKDNFLEIWQAYGVFFKDIFAFTIISSQVFLKEEMFHTNFVKNHENHSLFNFFEKNWRICNNVNILQRETSHGSKYNMAHAHCMPDKKGYKHTIGILNKNSFLASITIRWKNLSFSFISKLSILLRNLLEISTKNPLEPDRVKSWSNPPPSNKCSSEPGSELWMN